MRGERGGTIGAGILSGAARAAAGGDTVADLQQRIDVLTAFAGGIVFEMDREGRYLRVWTGEPQLLARPVDEMLGRTVSEVLGEEAGSLFLDAFAGAIASGNITSFVYTLDVQAGRRTFLCEARAVAREGDTTITLLVRDITEAKALEAKLVQAERLAALGLLAASVGHEVRQPLAYVGTSLDVLERELAGLELSPEAREALANVRAGARRIGEIATSLDLLAGRRKRTTAPVDIRLPLRAALDLCASAFTGVRVEMSVPDVPLVVGNEGELCQVFANLLLNAAQSGAEDNTLRVSLEHTGGQLRMTVIDTGAGISPDHLSRIFDPFFTTKERGGTGLGLFITRSIVEAHGGTIEVASEVGRGTRVDVFLPVCRVSDLPKEPTTGVRPVAARRAEPVKHARRRLSLLIVDDEPRFLDSLRLALEEDHVVETMARSADALAALAFDAGRYDLVLCDLAMPEIDGAAFYERMVALGVADRFVLMTAGAYAPGAAEFVARRVCPTISKPFVLERLLTLLDEVSARRLDGG